MPQTSLWKWAVEWRFDSPEETRAMAVLAAGVTHDHPEGIKGTGSTAAIFLARTGHSKVEIKVYVEREFGYDLSRTLEEIRPGYRFDESCQGTVVPQAITAFLESTDFEGAIHNAVSLGGDSDTLAAITGSIAEAAYGVPQWIRDQAWTYLDEPLREVLRRWREELFRRNVL